MCPIRTGNVYPHQRILAKAGLTSAQTLFHRHRFCQIARLIDVCPHENGCMIGNQLHGKRIDERVGKGMHFGHFYGRHGFAPQRTFIRIAQEDDPPAPGSGFLNI